MTISVRVFKTGGVAEGGDVCRDQAALFAPRGAGRQRANQMAAAIRPEFCSRRYEKKRAVSL